MKRITFTLITLALAGSISHAQMTNGDMENWFTQAWSVAGPSGSGNAYYEPGPDATRTGHFFRTLNEVADLPSPLTGPLTCSRSDTAHGGSYSARIQSTTLGTFFIPGFVGTGNIDIVQQTIHLGRPYTTRPNSFEAWYMYAPVGSDSAKFEVFFSKFNTLTQVSDVIGTGTATITSAASSWTNVGFNITWTAPDNPDTVVVIASSSGGYDLVNLFASAGEAGSMLWVDDMTLNAGFIGIEEDYINENVSIYPNPATDFINISTPNLPENLRYAIFDMNGKQLLTGRVNGNNSQVDISTLASGVYGLVIQDDFNLIHRTRIIKQ